MEPVVVIMAGGTGTRFWPISTKKRPKQFLKLFGNRSLLQMSFDRAEGFVSPERVFILTNERFVPMVHEQLPEIPGDNIIGEPQKRDTAAAVALAAYIIQQRFGNSVIVTLTADQLIEPPDVFRKTILSAVRKAEKSDSLYTFGIQPVYPATCYGYLERGSLITTDDGIEHYELMRFKEKPEIETAQEYIKSGRFYWNSGMFVWSADTIIKNIDLFLPDHAQYLSNAVKNLNTPKWKPSLEKAFSKIPAVSVDFGIMEKASDVRCVASTFSWNDVGGWLALQDYLPVDNKGNHYHGNVVISDAHNNLIYSEDNNESVAAIGISNLVIVRSGSNTLIAQKDRLEDIKKLIEKIQ